METQTKENKDKSNPDKKSVHMVKPMNYNEQNAPDAPPDEKLGGNGSNPEPDMAAVEEIDIEAYTQSNPKEKKPKAQKYAYRVNKIRLSSKDSTLTGRQILTAAGLVPVTEYRLRQKSHHGEPIEVGLDQIVDLREPGIERFVANKNHVQDGLARYQFEVPTDDRAFLDSLGLEWEAIRDSSTLWIIVRDVPLPVGFNVTQASVAFDVTSYPAGAIDMAFFSPSITRADGRIIPQTEAHRSVEGQNWQQWSRHRVPGVNDWDAAVDCIETHYAYMQDWFNRELQR